MQTKSRISLLVQKTKEKEIECLPEKQEEVIDGEKLLDSPPVGVSLLLQAAEMVTA